MTVRGYRHRVLLHVAAAATSSSADVYVGPFRDEARAQDKARAVERLAEREGYEVRCELVDLLPGPASARSIIDAL